METEYQTCVTARFNLRRRDDRDSKTSWRYLRDVKRRELADRLEDSNEDGDISDNSEYEDLKEDLVMTDRRIQELEYLLATAEPIEPSQGRTVHLGSVVTIVDSDGEEATWTLVDPAEADTRAGSISTESPVGRALMGATRAIRPRSKPRAARSSTL